MSQHSHQTAPTQFVDAAGVIYPDANHGSLYQYPDRFVRHISMFLSE